MKKIIDVNYFQNPELERYFRSGKDNIAVLCDYSCMEAYKGNISKSIEILSKFPDQVIILKGTRKIIKLTLQSHDTFSFEDPDQTKRFAIFCKGVHRAGSGDSTLASHNFFKRQLASRHFENMRKDAAIYAEGIRKI